MTSPPSSGDTIPLVLPVSLSTFLHNQSVSLPISEQSPTPATSDSQTHDDSRVTDTSNVRASRTVKGYAIRSGRKSKLPQRLGVNK